MHFIVFDSSGNSISSGYSSDESLPDGAIECLEDAACHYDRYRLVNGAVTEIPASEAPAPIPTTVTMRQAKLALIDAGKYEAVEAAIAAMSGAQKLKAQIEWTSATCERDSPFLQEMAQGLGLDEAALDALFTHAAGL